tara:strand:+ start:224 stop:466 length:243 start_codon:yes stop_codon:yes gene_type:complete
MTTSIKEDDIVRHSETKVFYRVKRITTTKLVDLNEGRERKHFIAHIDGGDTKTMYTIENCDTGLEKTEHQLLMNQYVKVE